MEKNDGRIEDLARLMSNFISHSEYVHEQIIKLLELKDDAKKKIMAGDKIFKVSEDDVFSDDIKEMMEFCENNGTRVAMVVDNCGFAVCFASLKIAKMVTELLNNYFNEWGNKIKENS